MTKSSRQPLLARLRLVWCSGGLPTWLLTGTENKSRLCRIDDYVAEWQRIGALKSSGELAGRSSDRG